MDAVAEFVELVQRDDPPLDLAALLIAAAADPELDVDFWRTALDRLAEGVDSLAALRQRLFVEHGLVGNTADYTDPRNSLLPDVLTRRRGIPISLAVVTVEVGRRAGIALDGVGMPGHFLVGVRATGTYLDVFAGGAELDVAGCAERYRTLGGQGFDASLLAPTPTPAILARMLENLRGSFQARRRPADVEWVLRMRMALPGAGLAHLVELADALGDQARWDEGATLLLAHPPALPPAQQAALRLRAKALMAHLN